MVVKRHTRGFTLAEVLVALSILAMIGMLSYGVFSRAMESRDRAEVITRHYHEIRQAMLRMSREISMAYLSCFYDVAERRTKTIFATQRAAAGMRLDFTSFSHFKMKADAHESDENELSYFVEPDHTHPGKSALIRREKNRIDDDPTKGGKEQVLAEGVTDLKFAFYDPKQDRWDDEWDSSASEHTGPGNPALPLFVRIELTTQSPAGKEEKFVTKTRLFMTKRFAGFLHQCLD
jgi:general secretion pathway protein J